VFFFSPNLIALQADVTVVEDVRKISSPSPIFGQD